MSVARIGIPVQSCRQRNFVGIANIDWIPDIIAVTQTLADNQSSRA
jgi:hypothetical protein